MSNKRPLDRERKNGPATTPPVDQSVGAVAVAYVHRNEVHYSFFHSFMQLIGWDIEHEGRILRGGFIAERGATGDLAADRSKAVADFLRDDRAEWFMWIDTDMGFDADAIDRLVVSADPVDRPVMAGLTFAQRESEPDGMGGFRPTAWPVIMDWTVYEERGGFEVRWDYPRNTVTQCHGVGSAFVLIHRSVFTRMQAEFVERSGDPGWASWYTRLINPTTRELIGEDLSFCMRLMMCEIPVHVNTGVQTTHYKPIWLGEQDYWRQRALAPAPEATENLAVEKRGAKRFAVIPTHNRPERLRALVASLAGQCDHIIVLDNASEPRADREQLIEAWGKPNGLTVVWDSEQPPNLARFWNVMFDRCEYIAQKNEYETWDVAVLNDDAIVPAGWYDVCATVLRGHPTAAVAHTGATPVHQHELVNAYPYPREKRMCPWAFVVRGELGLRADEQFKWFYNDDDFNRQAIDAGGVLAAPGPLVINAHAVQSTRENTVLAEQAEKDRIAFEAKWADTL